MPSNISKNSKTSAKGSSIHQKELDFNDTRYATSTLPPTNHRLNLLLNYTGSNKKVLDLGCGTGFFAKILLNKHPHVWGIDASQKALTVAQKIPNTTFIRANLEEDLPFPDNEFEVITAGEIIEHLYDTSAFLQEIRRVLKKNGTLVLSTPNIASLGRRLFLLLGINPLIETELSPEAAGHVRYFTQKSLISLLNKNGFTVTQKTSDSVNFNNQLDGLNSKLLAKLFPTLGASIIVACTNQK